MIFKSSKFRGFTVVELLVVIVVIGILSTVAAVSYRGVQRDARDSERETDIQIIMASLERFYDENGHYPGGTAVTGASGGTAGYFQNTLGVPVQALTTPGSTSTSIVHGATTWGDSSNFIHTRYTYTPYTSANGACSMASCVKYSLRYKKESDNSNVAVNSRYGW